MAKKKVAKRAPRAKSDAGPPASAVVDQQVTARDQLLAKQVDVSSVVKTLLAGCRTAFNDSKIIIGTKIPAIGIALPAFCLEYLLQSNGLALGTVMQFVGAEGSFKSAFAAEVGRWFIDQNDGILQWYEHESKISDDWLPSIVGWEKADTNVLIESCESIEDWQSKLQYFHKRHLDFWLKGEKVEGKTKRKGPGMVYPVLHVVDSVVGKLAQESQDSIERQGYAGRAFPIEALSLTNFLKAFAGDICESPETLLLINQLKLSKDKQGFNVRGKAGGHQKEFQESIELELSRTASKEYKMYSEARLHIKCHKNSLGVTGRSIPACVQWWNVRIPEVEGQEDQAHSPTRQVTVWDWYSATIDMLLRFEDTNGTKRKEVVDLVKVPDVSKVWSKRLGIGQKEAVTFTEAGEILHRSDGVMRDLREIFGIKRRAIFCPGQDYGALLNARRERAAKKTKTAK